ncbi:MAG TPA: tetratricopeptide repeat protein [Sphingomicrobium sp.]|nr:tetratricopeptide repeat protein [Sphingomicrobium sp.]
MERRLSAILAADVVGYSRLMGANEVGTLTALNGRRVEVIEPRIAEHNGRVVKLTGDGLLVEFPSVVNAVECATSIQQEMRARNVDIPEDRRIELRIGINLGDVIAEGDDIFGDGVNVAARIETAGRPGGVTVSASVRDHIGNKLDLGFEDMGEQQLKNIAQPVRIYEVIIAGSTDSAIAVGAMAVGPERPSIAVLPFTNMSGDPEQEFFSDGITEDIITDLSKCSGLFVVGRNTSFTYKGKSVQLPRVASELGVKFLLEGSVRKAGQRVRVTGQLIDGQTGGHVWADRYDRDLTDIFAIQDEITKTIVDQLRVRLLPEEKDAIGQSPTTSVEAYTYYLKGRQFFHNATRFFLTLARQMFVKATEADPSFARAYAGIANCDARRIGWYGELISEAEVLANADKALALDPQLSEAHAARGDALSILGHDAEARAAFEKAMSLDPNSFEASFLYARYCNRTGDFERAADLYVRSLELMPEDPQSPLLLQATLRALGRDEESRRYGELGIKRAEEALRNHPEWSRPAQLGAASLAGLGQREKAIEWLERAVAIDPDDYLTLYNAACTWAQLGETERAYELLEKWASHAGLEKTQWLKQDPDFDPLRGEERFQRLLAQLDLAEPARI